MGNENPAAAPAPRAVIADDERLMRDQLRARLAEVWPELQIAGEAKNGLEAVDLVQQLRPDIVFLDIRMPGLTGVDAARRIAQLPPREGHEDDLLPEIVFITAYDQYAVEAFEQGNLIGTVQALLTVIDQLERMQRDEEIEVRRADEKRLMEYRVALRKVLPGNQPELAETGRGL